MSAKRAAIRRERKERRKAEHRKAPDGEARRAAEQGRMDGRTLAACIIINVLYDQFGFRDKRLMRMVKQINQEALKFDQEATRFNLEFYAGRLQERIQAAQIRPKVESLTETIYGSVRDEYFISSGAVMFMVLNVPSVRPHIPAELEYVGTVVEGQICFDYYLLPDGQLRQEYRRPEQDIILSYRDEESLQHIRQRERKKRAAIAEPPSENVV